MYMETVEGALSPDLSTYMETLEGTLSPGPSTYMKTLGVLCKSLSTKNGHILRKTKQLAVLHALGSN